MSSFPRPTLPALIARVTQQIQATLPDATPVVLRAVTSVIGKVLAQELLQEYAYLDFLADMFFVVSAQGVYLDNKGVPIGIGRQPGAAATGPIQFSGAVLTPPATIPAGAIVQTADGSQSFSLTAAVTIGSAGTGSGTIQALALGSAGNLAAGTGMVLVVAVAGVVPTPVVIGTGLVGGLDLESDAAYRTLILARQQTPPQGGASRDYVAWVKLVPGVTRAWVYALARGAGTVDVAAVFDARGGAAIIPTYADQANIQAELNIERPVTADVQAIALAASAVNVQISNLVPSAGTTKAMALASVTSSLAQLFSGATPGGATYGDGIQPGQTGGTIQLQQISDAISETIGVDAFDLTQPTADVTAPNETILVLGTVTAP